MNLRKIEKNSLEFYKLLCLEYPQNKFSSVLEQVSQTKTQLLSDMATLALQYDYYIESELSILSCKNDQENLKCSKIMIACLLANGFFGKLNALSENCPGISFIKLFQLRNASLLTQKLKCIFHYFECILYKSDTNFQNQMVEFELSMCESFPDWNSLDSPLDLDLIINQKDKIEDFSDCIQIDFANASIGGGVLGHGCVQEEILFLIYPELIISRYFTPILKDNESVIVHGISRYSNYVGYKSQFEWRDCHVFDQTKVTLVMVDALDFSRSSKNQFLYKNITRECNKLYTGLVRVPTNIPIVTGNWGCGVFQGNVQLKFLIQWIVCSFLRKKMIYCTLSTMELENVDTFVSACQGKYTIGQFLDKILEFSPHSEQLFDYLLD